MLRIFRDNAIEKQQLYLAVQAQGWGRKGTHALMLALEQLANVKRP